MPSTISCTEEKLACLHNNAVLSKDYNDGHLALFDKYFFKTTNSLKTKGGYGEDLCFIFIVNNKIKKTIRN